MISKTWSNCLRFLTGGNETLVFLVLRTQTMARGQGRGCGWGQVSVGVWVQSESIRQHFCLCKIN